TGEGHTMGTVRTAHETIGLLHKPSVHAIIFGFQRASRCCAHIRAHWFSQRARSARLCAPWRTFTHLQFSPARRYPSGHPTFPLEAADACRSRGSADVISQP